MRLGKKKEKEKESESKSQVVEGINRLVCQAKTHHSLLKGESPSDVRPVWFVLINALLLNSGDWWSGMEQCQVLPAVVPVANAHPPLPRRSFYWIRFVNKKIRRNNNTSTPTYVVFFLSFSPSCFRFFLFPFLLSFHWLYVVHLSHPTSFSFLCDSTRLVSPLLLAWYRFLHIGRLYVANGTTPVRSLKAPPLSVVCVCSDEIN